MKVNNIDSLTQKGLINNQLLYLISELTLEDLIAIKIELSSKHINNRLYNFKLWHKMPYITREALLRVAVTCTNSTSEAARFLGITKEKYFKVVRDYGIK
jgi:hypothetical protein